MRRKRREFVITDAIEDVPGRPKKRRKLCAYPLPFLAWDCWSVVLSFVESWTTILEWDNCFRNRSFHARALSEVEHRIAGFIGNGRVIDRICVGMKTRKTDPALSDTCHHTRQRNACRAVYYVPTFHKIPLSVRDTDMRDAVRCSVTGAVVRPTIIKKRVPRYWSTGFIRHYAIERKRCVENPKWLLHVKEFRCKDATPWDILLRALQIAKGQIRSLRQQGARANRDCCVASQHVKAWLARMEINWDDLHW